MLGAVFSDEDPLGWVGSTIAGKYKVEEFIEEGGFGAVYRGLHLDLESPIAIKCITTHPGLDEAERNKVVSNLKAEAKILFRLSKQTTGIVQVLDRGAA